MDRPNEGIGSLEVATIFRALITLGCVLLLGNSSRAWAQADESDTMAALANPRTITEWLSSTDPRLVAWGAHFAGDSSDPELLTPVMKRLKVAIQDPDFRFHAPYGPDHNANLALLDALLQRKAIVSAEMIQQLREGFPAEAALLATELPPESRVPLLQEWYAERNYRPHDGLARVAAMLLAKTPQAGFAASVLAESEDHLLIMVTLEGGGAPGGSMGGACGDAGGAGANKGWPPLFFYLLEENSRNVNDRLVVEAGGDRITARRISTSAGFGSCFSVRPFTVETNHHLLAEMLGTDDEGVPFPTRHGVTIAWKSKDQFQSDLGSLIAAEDQTLHVAVSVFRDRGLLSQEEAETVLPRLVVSIHFDPAIKR